MEQIMMGLLQLGHVGCQFDSVLDKAIGTVLAFDEVILWQDLAFFEIATFR